MYKTHKELENTFRRWICVGVIVFGILFLLLAIRPSFCPPNQDERWAGKGYYTAKSDKDGRQVFEYTFSPVQEKGAEADEKKTDTTNKNYLVAWLCEEELKVTDLLIALFTYCTVCVGLFAMRYTDITTRRNERAYLIGGGPYGLARSREIAEALKEGRLWPEHRYFREPRRMTIQNYGKTPGFITKVEYGFCPEKEWPKGKSVSEVLRDEEFRRGHLESPPEYAQDPIQPNTEWLPFRHVEFRRDEKFDDIFFGRIDYVDIFKDAHYSTFKLLIKARYSEPMDNTYAYDWD